MSYATRAGGLTVCLAALLAVAAAGPADDVQEAVDRGVAFLKAIQRADGGWPYQGKAEEEIGATALAGLTLLECGVAADDPAVERTANLVRNASISCTHTYSLSLMIMFLDRLGDTGDEQLIQSMGVRLLGGQNDQGGWTYHCPSLDENEQRRLSNLKPQRNELVGRRNRPTAPKTEIRPNAELPKEIKDQIARLNNSMALGGDRHPADNSNTQFAALGLWVARRHGIPVERAMIRLAGRFRLSQAPDGSWHYMSATSPGRAGSGTPAMTCAGLLALAVAHGTASQSVMRTDRRGGFNDPFANQPHSNSNFGKEFAVRSGLLYLGNQIGHARFPTARKRGKAAAGAPPDYYFFWSLERVGMIYGLKTIGKKDWYAWGSQILLDHQNEDGSWHGKYADGIDTCFALLFLRRANVARDLTATLAGKVQDPGDVKLRAGGIGGEALLSNGPKPAEETLGHAKPADKEKRRGGEGETKTVERGQPLRKAATAEVKPVPATPPSSEEKEAAELAKRLIQAPPDKQEAILEILKERKGVAYSDALAQAITHLKGPNMLKARDALAERLSRMTASTLREKLQEESPEIRRAAALACAMKEDKSFIPDLIARLEDPQRSVSYAAHAALKELAGKDFGPAVNASATDRTEAVMKWKEWWKNQGGNPRQQ
ncbi:MAG TPA: hypothetical protein VKU02_20540 [Gemmataceae bacterium]|nr:hypothetical protein [Gemmataceae bacterium]